MWNKRKDEDYTPKSAQAVPAPAEPRKEGLPLSTTPVRNSEFDTSRGSATIGKSVTIKGEIYSREDLVVDGEVEGSIELSDHRLTIGPNGKLRAGVKAREIVILGTINGNVEALDKIDIRKDARLVGDIKTARIIIEDGAYFKGSIDIVKQEPPKVAQPARPQQAAAAVGAQPSVVPTNALK